MTDKKPELDVEIIKRLYEFGGLMAYKVQYASPLDLSIVTTCVTFNEDFAKSDLVRLHSVGIAAVLFSSIVKFDGAFSKKDDPA